MKTLLKRLLLCGCACGLALAVAGCGEEKKAQAEPPRPVRTLVAKSGLVSEEVVQTGDIQPHTETDLGFRIDGRVATRSAEVGMTVSKDQLLATLDRRDIENELRSAEAEVTRADAAESLAKSGLERQRTLFEKQIVARVRVEEAETAWREANARAQSAQSALQIARNKLGYAELRAPYDGVVTAVAINGGQVVSAGQAAIKLASVRELDAVFNVSERLYLAAPEDVKIAVALASNPSVKTIGALRDANPSADPVTRTYRVRFSLPDAPPEMTLGAAVTGHVLISGKPLFVLPASALTDDNGKPAVFIVMPVNRVLVRRPVTVARYRATEVLVDSGLVVGDAVVTAGVSKLRPGQKVAFDGKQGESVK